MFRSHVKKETTWMKVLQRERERGRERQWERGGIEFQISLKERTTLEGNRSFENQTLVSTGAFLNLSSAIVDC